MATILHKPWRVLAALLPIALAGCDRDAGDAGQGGAAGLIIAPPGEVRLMVGRSSQLLAWRLDGDVTTPADEVSWSSSDPTVAEADSQGLVTALSEGSATVQVVVGGRRAEAPVLVVARTHETLSIDPSELLAPLGQVAVAVARADDDVVTGEVAWSIVDPAIAQIVGPGEMLGRAAGGTRVVASWLGLHAEAELTVIPLRPTPGGADVGGDGDDPQEGTWELGPWVDSVDQFRPFAESDAVALGTCAQGLHHFWLSGFGRDVEGVPGRGTATLRVVRPDPRERALRLVLPFGPHPGGTWLPRARIDLARNPETWVGRTVELVIETEKATPGVSTTARFVIGEIQEDCCEPCGS